MIDRAAINDCLAGSRRRLAKSKLPKGVRLVERLSVIRLCGHVEQLTGPVCRYSYAQLTKLTVTPCNDCKGEYRDDN
jgi:hypothetical protein